MQSSWGKLKRSLKERGLGGTVRALVRRAFAPQPQHHFDAHYGVDTSGIIPGADLGAGHAHDSSITAYVGMSPSRFEASMQRWQQSLEGYTVNEYSFIDLGSGKGRAIMMASQLPFREVIGVELDAKLAAIAEANLKIWQRTGHSLQPVRSVCGDATEFPFPDGPCLIYLANPFGAPVMKKLLEKLTSQRGAGGAVLDVLYQNAEQEAVFREFPALQEIWRAQIPIAEKDQTADLVYTQEDWTVCYRLAAKTF